jgi:hypothetical protein
MVITWILKSWHRIPEIMVGLFRTDGKESAYWRMMVYLLCVKFSSIWEVSGYGFSEDGVKRFMEAEVDVKGSNGRCNDQL